ncbi:hypothetical protein, partial [Actinocorallia lasiicapitis]
PARLVCVTVPVAGGAPVHQGWLIGEAGRVAARDCADGVTGLWWRAENKRWYYLAAAAHGVELKVAKAKRKDGLHLVKGSKGKRPPVRTPKLSVG